MRYQRHFSGQIVTPLHLSAFLYIHNTRDKFIFQRVSKYFHLIRLIGEQGPVDQVYRNWDIEKLFLFLLFLWLINRWPVDQVYRNWDIEKFLFFIISLTHQSIDRSPIELSLQQNNQNVDTLKLRGKICLSIMFYANI